MAADIEQAHFQLLAGSPSITSLLGTQSEASIFPVRADEGATLPVLVYHKLSGPSLHSKDGDMHLAHPRYQFTCWAKKYGDAKAVITALRNALNAYTGPTLNGVNVPQIITDGEQDLNDPSSLEYGVSLDALVWHSD